MSRSQPTWFIPTRIEEDEILSSWLIRSALDSGCSPLTMIGLLWEKRRVLTIDIDRALNHQMLTDLQRHSNESFEKILNSTLSNSIKKITDKDTKNQSIPWILALGQRNRHNYSGRQICIECLKSDSTPYYRKNWRFAWNTICSKHNIHLIDACPHCHQVLQPFQIDIQHQNFAICTSCGLDMKEHLQHPIESTLTNFQSISQAALESGFSYYQNEQVSSIEWFMIMRMWITGIRALLSSKSNKAHDFLNAVHPHANSNTLITPIKFEFLHASERFKILEILQSIVQMQPYQLIELANQFQISQSYLWSVNTKLPTQLSEIYTQLKPSNRRKVVIKSTEPTSQPKSKLSVQRKWLKLLRKMKTQPPTS